VERLNNHKSVHIKRETVVKTAANMQAKLMEKDRRLLYAHAVLRDETDIFYLLVGILPLCAYDHQ